MRMSSASVADFVDDLKVDRGWLIFAALSLATTMYKPIAALALLALAIEPAFAFYAPSQFGASLVQQVASQILGESLTCEVVQNVHFCWQCLPVTSWALKNVYA